MSIKTIPIKHVNLGIIPGLLRAKCVVLSSSGILSSGIAAEVHCDKVVEEALSNYWEKQKLSRNKVAQWIRRDERAKHFKISKTLDSLVNEQPEVPFMV